MKKLQHKVAATSVGLAEFNKKLAEVDGRVLHLHEPDMKYEKVSNDIWLYEDNRRNYHLIFKEAKNKIIHYKLDPWTGEADPNNKDDRAGYKASRRLNTLKRKYNEEIDSPVNNPEFSWQFEDICNHDYSYRWVEDVHAYDMNSCYPTYFKYPLPYGHVIAENSIVKQGEIGFDIIINIKHKKILKTKFEGEQADIIFKTKKFKCLEEFADSLFALKRHYKQIGDESNYNNIKVALNALHGNLKYHNVYMAAAIIGYAYREMHKYIRPNTIMVHCDEIHYIGNMDSLFDLGDEMGQFHKNEHNGQSFYFRSESDKEWSDGTIIKKGEKKSRRGKDRTYYFNSETRRMEKIICEEKKENTQFQKQ